MEGEWVMSATEVDDAIERISRDIVHVLDGADDFTLVGVMSGGMPAARISESRARARSHCCPLPHAVMAAA